MIAALLLAMYAGGVIAIALLGLILCASEETIEEWPDSLWLAVAWPLVALVGVGLVIAIAAGGRE